MAQKSLLDRSLSDDPSATSDALVAAIREAERAKNQLSGLQAELAARLRRRRGHRP